MAAPESSIAHEIFTLPKLPVLSVFWGYVIQILIAYGIFTPLPNISSKAISDSEIQQIWFQKPVIHPIHYLERSHCRLS
jgi:hypothetical protein